MSAPEHIGSLLRQLDPERPLHRFFSPKVRPTRRRRDDPRVISFGFHGRFRTATPSDACHRFEFLNRRVDVLPSQVGLELRPKPQRRVPVEQLDVLNAREKPGQAVGSTSRDQIVSAEAATTNSFVKWIGDRLGVMSSGHLIASYMSTFAFSFRLGKLNGWRARSVSRSSRRIASLASRAALLVRFALTALCARRPRPRTI